MSWAQPTPEFEVETLYLTPGISYPGLLKNIPHVWFLRLYSLIKNPQHDFPKMRGGQGPFGTFPKMNPFWEGDASLYPQMPLL